MSKENKDILIMMLIGWIIGLIFGILMMHTGK
jgi:hypothetical protein